MHKLIKTFIAVAVLGIAVQTFASKPAADEPAFSSDWQKMESSLAALDATE